MQFKKIKLSDWDRVLTYSQLNPTRQLNYSFEVLYLWRDICDFELAEEDGFLFIKTFHHSKHNFLFPLGSGDLATAVRKMETYAKEINCPFQLFQINNAQKTELERLFPDKYDIEPTRNEFEYIFESHRLANLEGKKLQPKRNHINYFINHNNWSFEKMDSSNLVEVMAYCHQWEISLDQVLDADLTMESSAFMNAIESFVCLELNGGILRVDNRIVGISMGCPITTDTYLVLFEKAEAEVRGAYPMINREFVRHFCTDFRYVNRAEDNGDSGLRQAKLSYYPDILEEVYVLRPKTSE